MGKRSSRQQLDEHQLFEYDLEVLGVDVSSTYPDKAVFRRRVTDYNDPFELWEEYWRCERKVSACGNPNGYYGKRCDAIAARLAEMATKERMKLDLEQRSYTTEHKNNS
jgi:hypothetical protein